MLGAAAAGAVLYFNPLSEQSAAQPQATDRVLHYSLPDQVLEFAVGEDASLFGQDTGQDSLWEETIDRTAVLGLLLNDAANQPVAIASRLMATSAETDLLLRGVLLSDHWLVTIPSEGTLFVRAESNAWPFLKNTLVPVWYLDRPWNGPAEYWPTVGPGADDSGVALGITGTFRGSEGSVVEHYEISALDPERELALANAELHLQAGSARRSPPSRSPSARERREIDAGVAEHVGCDACAVRHELLACNELPWAVDRVDGEQSSGAEIERGEAAPRRIAAQHDLVIARRQSRDLQLQVVLVGPEPRHLGVRHGRAEQRRGGNLGLMNRVRHGFEPHAALEQGVRMVRAVAGREDVRIGRARELVDDDAVAAGQPGGGGELDVGHDADADDHDVARELSAVDGLDRSHAGRAVQRLDCRAAVNHDAAARCAAS